MQAAELTTELERHHAVAFGWALACCRWDEAAAEDALQASYLKVLEGSAMFAGRSSFRTWLFAVIRRTAGEQLRRRALGRWLPLAALRNHRSEGEPDAEAARERSQATGQLLAALGALPTRQREVLHLVFYEELTVAEAAEVIGVRVGTARTHYERGKARLRRLLAEEGEP